MKKTSFGLLASILILLYACNSNNNKTDHEGHDTTSAIADSSQHATSGDENIQTVGALYSNLDPKIQTTLKEATDHYLHMKNALISDDAKEAASGANALEQAVKRLDKSLLTAEQKTAYDELEKEINEHASVIGKMGENINLQREHFALLSEDFYGLVKTFGGGRAIYHDHCPMYNDNKGAMWLSETKEIKNPYYGAKMLTCGTVEEVIQ